MSEDQSIRVAMSFLKTDGRKIVDDLGREVRLRGFSFAGWLNFENFITGMPGHESGLRNAVATVLGEERARFFFTRFLNHFITEDDFKFIHSLGCNLVRIPFNYRHFESDDRPYEYLPEGFAWLDKAISWARKYGIYLILDMHAAQGSQNGHFYSDNNSGVASLWSHKIYQSRAAALWREIARRYCDEPAIAGFDILNEPIPEHISQLNSFYREAVEAIRKVDKRHMLVIEGDGYSSKFDGLDHPFDTNAVYSIHFYSCCGMDIMEYPGVCSHNGQYYDRNKLEQEYTERSAFMRRHNVPNWFGETSISFQPTVSEASRMRFLEDMLSIAEEQGDSWAFGIYKDLGKTGIVHIGAESEWMRRTALVRDIGTTLRCNPFADRLPANKIDEACRSLGEYVTGVIGALDEQLSVDEMSWTIKLSLCEGLLARRLQIPFARQFSGMGDEDIDRMMQSFAFKNCSFCNGWVDVIKNVTGAK